MYHPLKMSKSQRMVMVPEWMARSMQTKYRSEVSPFISGLSDIEDQIAKLLRNKKMAGDRKMMLYNELLQQYDDVKRQKQKASIPSVRIHRDEPVTPSPRPRPTLRKPTPRKSRIPLYQTPKRTAPIRRRIRLEDIPEYDDEDGEEDDPIIPFATPPYTAATSPYFQKNWKRTPVSKRLSGRWEKY